MGTTPPRVSIGLPVFNGHAYIAAAIDSVVAQTFVDLELIICDNASTDDTEEICRAYAGHDERIQYHRSDENVGAARNFNRTFELSSGEYFKWLAHDDILAPEYLERCVEALDSAPRSVVLCFPRRRFMTFDGRHIDYEPHLLQSKRAAGKSLNRITFARLVRVCDSRFPIFVFGLMRTAAVMKTRLIGAFRAADLVFVAEMRLLGEFREIPEEMFFQRLHAPTPDVLDRMTRSGDAAWFDPHGGDRLMMSEVKVLSEYVRAIHRSEASGSVKRRCYAALSGYLLARPRRWMILLGRRMRRLAWRCWSRMSLGAVKASKYSSIPLRCWAFTSGLRHCSSERMKLACSGPWLGTHAALMVFAAERVCMRDDPLARRMLIDWLTDSCEARRTAAAEVMGRSPSRFGPAVRGRLTEEPKAACAESVFRLLADAGGPEGALAWSEVLAGCMPKKP